MISINSAAAIESITITSPANNTYFGTNPIILNWSVTNTTDITNYNYTCWYVLGTSSSLFDCRNISTGSLTIFGGQDKNNMIFYVNRSLGSAGNVNVSYFTFYMDSVVPTINIVFPTANAYYNYNITNCSYIANDVNLNACWFNNGYGVNVSNICNQTIYTTMANLTLNIGSNIWRIYARDILNNTNFQDVTFNYDPNNPLMRDGPNYTFYDHDANINFKFNEDVQATMWYWTNISDRNSTINITEWNINLEFNLDGLVNNTIYFFNITVMDRGVNRVYYGPYNFTFTLTAPQITYSCYTNAICGAWGACSAMGLQSRTCNKINTSCGYASNPLTTQACDYSALTHQPPPTNTTNSTKAAWGGLSDNAKFAIIGLAIVIIIGVGIAMFFRFKNPEYNDIPRAQEEQPYTPASDTDTYLGDNA